LIETYLSSDATSLSSPKITVDSSKVNRINYKNESLTFKTEYDTLVNDFTDFKNNYNAWKATLGSYAQVDKLVPDSFGSAYFTENPKHKKISEYINTSSIHSDLLIDGSILREKLNSNVVGSLDLADSSVQSIKLNGGAELKDVNKAANINALTKLKIQDFNASEEEGSVVYKEYSVGSDGIISISD
jgi:hypothetical protein